jgi:hypothetical protein
MEFAVETVKSAGVEVGLPPLNGIIVLESALNVVVMSISVHRYPPNLGVFIH